MKDERIKSLKETVEALMLPTPSSKGRNDSGGCNRSNGSCQVEGGATVVDDNVKPQQLQQKNRPSYWGQLRISKLRDLSQQRLLNRSGHDQLSGGSSSDGADGNEDDCTDFRSSNVF